jgi:hypothetical protein
MCLRYRSSVGLAAYDGVPQPLLLALEGEKSSSVGNRTRCAQRRVADFRQTVDIIRDEVAIKEKDEIDPTEFERKRSYAYIRKLNANSNVNYTSFIRRVLC